MEPGDVDADGITVRWFEPGDEVAIQKALDESFDVHWTVDEWHWRYLEQPYDGTRVLVMVADGEVVGHAASAQLPVWIQGELKWMKQPGDLVLREAYRERGIMPKLMKFAQSYADTADFVLSFPVDRMLEMVRNFNPAFVSASRLPRWVRWRTAAAAVEDSGRRVPAVASKVAELGVAAVRAQSRRPAGTPVVTLRAKATADFDELARRSADIAPCIRVRDREYVQWRWLDQPGDRWTLAVAHENDELTGWVVFGVSMYDGPKSGHIGDLLATDRGTTRALLAFAADALERDGIDRVAFEYLDPRPWARNACLRAGFIPRHEGPNVMIHQAQEPLRSIVGDPSNWYLTIGDSDLA